MTISSLQLLGASPVDEQVCANNAQLGNYIQYNVVHVQYKRQSILLYRCDVASLLAPLHIAHALGMAKARTEYYTYNIYVHVHYYICNSIVHMYKHNHSNDWFRTMLYLVCSLNLESSPALHHRTTVSSRENWPARLRFFIAANENIRNIVELARMLYIYI